MTLDQAVSQFVDHLTNQHRAQATIIAYKKDVEQLVELITGRALTPKDITAQHVEEYKQLLTKGNYSNKSISRKLNSIKAFFRFLIEIGELEHNPGTEVIHPKVVSTAPRILNRVEYRALRDACRNDIRISAIVELLLQTGMRISELSDLKLSDVLDDGKTIKLHTDNQTRTIPLNKPAIKALSEYLEDRPPVASDFVFVTKTGKQFLVRNIRAAIDRYFRIAGINDAKVNDLRHTFIAEQLGSGTSLVYISQLVGHKRLTTTERYLKYLGEEKSLGHDARLQEL